MAVQTVAVLDYGMSNLRSVIKALEHVADGRFRIELAQRPEQLQRADRLVFPGQGAIRRCMDNLSQNGLQEALLASLRSIPYLGICLGQQCLLDGSEENNGTAGLGIIPGLVRRFPPPATAPAPQRCKVPHMGWNEVSQQYSHPLWRGIGTGERFYFVHSYYPSPERMQDVAGTTRYAMEFASAIARDNIFAVQFHPEKSQKAGLLLLRNFLDWKP